ncbi:unnamed protein product [Leptidea sinapis]|uniref:Uncharacterized protein n=1 Tax=Leptidea sinapis TaxID=189913 RepID=A0A5E4QKU7_9NEOP|nr:unnamed protein product [Leptidea sinapis]
MFGFKTIFSPVSCCCLENKVIINVRNKFKYKETYFTFDVNYANISERPFSDSKHKLPSKQLVQFEE